MDTIRINDPRAPRYVKKYYDLLNEESFFDELRELNPELAKYTNSSIKEFIIRVNKRMADELIDNRSGLRLPEGLGITVVAACKINPNTSKNNIDYKLSRELGKRVPFVNSMSDGYIGKVKYTKDINFRNSSLWCFDAVRSVTRKVSAIFKEPGGYKKYIVFTVKHHMGHLFRPVKLTDTKVKAKEQIRKELLDNYNEFDI